MVASLKSLTPWKVSMLPLPKSKTRFLPVREAWFQTASGAGHALMAFGSNSSSLKKTSSP